MTFVMSASLISLSKSLADITTLGGFAAVELLCCAVFGPQAENEF